jgi:hypothetical protein
LGDHIKEHEKGHGGEPEVNRPLGKLSSRWEDNTKKNLKNAEYEILDWTNLTGVRDTC